MADSASPNQRRVVHYSGRVQRVGFRYATRDLAARFAVAGFVENLPDGRVRLVAEGAAEELDRFLHSLQALLERNIRSVDQLLEPATGEFNSFTIRH